MKFLAVLFEILWARRAIVVVATLASLAGGFVVLEASPKRYVATARVVLDYIKPDPVTGVQVGRKQVEAYIESQMEFIHSYSVSGPAAEALGLMDNPDLIDRYAALPGEKPEYPLWVAQQVTATVTVAPYEDSNILEIRYRTSDPRSAEIGVEAIRSAYINATVASRRQNYELAAQGLAEKQAKLRAMLAETQAEQAQLERETGILMVEDKRDLDTETLFALVRPPPPNQQREVAAPVNAKTSEDLLQLNAALAQAEGVLGPNNPKLQALRLQQRLLKEQAARAASAAGDFGQQRLAAEQATAARIEQQKAKVLADRIKVLRIRLLQDLIDAYTTQIKSLTNSINEMRQVATAETTTIIAVGASTANPVPTFPNPTLILGGTGGLGLVLGALLALLCEMFARRVRNPRLLAQAAGAPLLAVVPRQTTAGRGVTTRRAPSLAWPRRKKAA